VTAEPSVLIFRANLLLKNAKVRRSPKPQGLITGRRGIMGVLRKLMNSDGATTI
jgi:hypothetical protein